MSGKTPYFNPTPLAMPYKGLAKSSAINAISAAVDSAFYSVYLELIGVGAVNGLLVKRSARTATSVLDADDMNYLVDITTGTFTQTIISATTLGDGWNCTLKNSGAGVITLEPFGAETVDGETSIVLNPGDARVIQSDGVNLNTIPTQVLATDAEVATGTDTEKAVTPAGLQGAIDSKLQAAIDSSLGNVDNTSDTDKPVSTLQQTALDLKAPLISPTFTGAKVATSLANGTSDTSVADASFVKYQITNAIKVGSVASRTTTGTWAISGLIVGLPVYLVTNSTISFSIISGTDYNNTTSRTIAGASEAIIPASSQIQLDVTAIVGTATVYQGREYFV